MLIETNANEAKECQNAIPNSETILGFTTSVASEIEIARNNVDSPKNS